MIDSYYLYHMFPHLLLVYHGKSNYKYLLPRIYMILDMIDYLHFLLFDVLH